MARPFRIEYRGAIYHVTSRGDGREDIYLSDQDRYAFLDLLGKCCSRFDWVVYAYCLMSNHYHLVLETLEPNLSQGMRQLNGVYTQYFNRSHSRVGHVFQGRFKAILVDKDAYLLELSRYVVLNPVRANMVRSVRDWRFSSYRATSGQEAAPSWLNTDWLLGQLSHTKSRAQERYKEFVSQGKGLPIWTNLKQQIYLGDDRFIKKVQPKLKSDRDLGEIPQAQRRASPKPLEYYRRRFSGRQALAEAYASGGYTLKSIADFFGVHYSTVSRAAISKE